MFRMPHNNKSYLMIIDLLFFHYMWPLLVINHITANVSRKIFHEALIINFEQLL